MRGQWREGVYLERQRDNSSFGAGVGHSQKQGVCGGGSWRTAEDTDGRRPRRL